MEEVKLIKMRCRKTGKFFCLEQKNGLVVNMIELSEADADKISTSPSVGTGLKTAPNLLPCLGCRSRNVGGCACAQTAKRKCNPKDKYNFQCVYCRELELIPAKAAMPKIYVTSPHYDDIAQVLDTMGLRHSPYRSRLDCDIFFINCGTNDAVDTAALRSFVENGGCVYISDLAYSHLVGAFPGYLEFDNSGGDEGRLTATVEDNELRNIVGQEIEVEFDLGSSGIAAIRGCCSGRSAILPTVPSRSWCLSTAAREKCFIPASTTTRRLPKRRPCFCSCSC